LLVRCGSRLGRIWPFSEPDRASRLSLSAGSDRIESTTLSGADEHDVDDVASPRRRHCWSGRRFGVIDGKASANEIGRRHPPRRVANPD
jgi:hypothetical protein